MTTSLLYVRHAEVFNPENVLYGRLARYGLSDNGKYFAKRAAEFLAAEPITAFYTSPLLRARQTTRFLAAPHVGARLHVRGELAEVRTSWQGTPYNDLPPDSTVYGTRRESTDETIDDVWRRMKHLFDLLVRQHRGEIVVCVSHGDPIKILTLGLKGSELNEEAMRQPEPARCSVTRFDLTDPTLRPTITYTDVIHKPSYVRIAGLDEIAQGSLKRVAVGRREVLLVRALDGTVYALANRCTHMRAFLHEGTLEGTVVTCPLHGTRFEAKDGSIVEGPRCGTHLTANFGEPGKELSPIEASHLQTYGVRLEGNDILLRRG
jgi:broad specificity phosphatase PhoE/nitrite reductase/ring-hydroxylating ferredoxin subunit